MRILLLNYEFPPLGGGAGRATFHLAHGLVERGHRVRIVTSRWREHEPWAVAGATLDAVPTARRGIHECGLRGAAQYVLRARELLRHIIREERFDVSHSFFSLPTGPLSLWLKTKIGLPYIVSLRGSDVPGYDPYAEQVTHKLLLPLTRRIWREAHRTVPNSHGLRELAQRTLPDCEMEVIYNGIDASLFRPLVPYGQRPVPPLRILCVSRLLERKGIHVLLEAFSRVVTPEVLLTIVGEGGYEQRLRELTGQLGLEAAVDFAGYIPNERMPQVYSEAHIFALPTEAESFAMVFPEAMACGLPIVSSTAGAVPEIVRDGEEGLLVPAGDVEALAEALQRLLEDEPLRTKMAHNARQRAETCFTWDAVVNAYEQLYYSATS